RPPYLAKYRLTLVNSIFCGAVTAHWGRMPFDQLHRREFISLIGVAAATAARDARPAADHAGDRRMRTHVIDQSPSEPRLHRALYVVKYLRAMVLNFFLVSVADVLYFGAGIKGVHFLGSDSIIDGFVKAAEEATGYRPTYPNWSAMVVLTVTFVWIYLS